VDPRPHSVNPATRGLTGWSRRLSGTVLWPHLADQNLNVRYCAASALKAVGPAAHAAVNALISALDTVPGGSPALDGPVRYYADVRNVAAEALGAIGSRARDAVPALKKALNDPDPDVRRAAADALQRIAVK
jgi:HEAT repeat protein